LQISVIFFRNDNKDSFIYSELDALNLFFCEDFKIASCRYSIRWG